MTQYFTKKSAQKIHAVLKSRGVYISLLWSPTNILFYIYTVQVRYIRVTEQIVWQIGSQFRKRKAVDLSRFNLLSVTELWLAAEWKQPEGRRGKKVVFASLPQDYI